MKENRSNNVYNLDGSRYDSDSGKKPRRSFLSSVTPAHIGAAVFLLVFIYLCINLYIYSNKEQVAIYEVQAVDLSYDTSFRGICVRDEKVVRADRSGYINYYIRNGAKAAKSSIVYSVDSGRNVYSELNNNFADLIFNTEEIREIKNMINTGMRNYDGSDLTWIDGFEGELTDSVYDYVNENLIRNMEVISAEDDSGSAFYKFRTDESGVISFKSDNFAGITSDDVVPSDFEEDAYKPVNLKLNGLVSEGDEVYRICRSEEWSVIAKVNEDFYKSMLEEENKEAVIYINSSSKPVRGALNLFERGKEYFAEVKLNERMPEYIDERFVSVEFVNDSVNGLKIPVTSITQKEYYIIPLDAFTHDENNEGDVLKREVYDSETGQMRYDDVYVPKFFSDGYYAYVDTSLFGDGDYVCNTDTGERYRISAVNELDGVYNVNKGYYIFVRIEKLRSNSEYTIVKRNTTDGLKLYDHIALNAGDAVEGNIIY